MVLLCTTFVAGGGAGTYSCISNSAPLLLSCPPPLALVVAGSPGDAPAERRTWREPDETDQL